MKHWLMLASALLVFCISGCGGGGGGNAVAPTTQPTLADYAGVWTVQNAGLPDNRLLIDNVGNVMISVSSSRAGAKRYKIGVCNNAGIVDIAGEWTPDTGVIRRIDGNGIVTPSAINLSVTVKDNDVTIIDGNSQGFNDDVPPPPPYENENGDVDAYYNLDDPPAPPLY